MILPGLDQKSESAPLRPPWTLSQPEGRGRKTGRARRKRTFISIHQVIREERAQPNEYKPMAGEEREQQMGAAPGTALGPPSLVVLEG